MRWTRVAMIGAIVLALPACEFGGQGSSLEEFCATAEVHKERFVTAMDDASSADILSGLVGAMAAVSDLSQMWDELAAAAPPEIATDTKAVAESYRKQMDNTQNMDVTNPLSGLSSSLIGSVQVSKPLSRVNEYVAANCPSVGRMF